MKAMLLAAGLGRRMHPLTLTVPKPVLPVLGRPLAGQILQQLGNAGVREVVLNLHHLPEAIRHVLCEGQAPGLPSLRFIEEPEIRGTAGGLRNARELLAGDGPVIVCNSDALSDISIPSLLERHRTGGYAATLALAPWRAGYSVVETTNGEVRTLGEIAAPRHSGPDSAYLFTGMQVVSRQLLERLPDRDPSCLVRDVYRDLARDGHVDFFVHDGFWWEYGDPELYLEGSLRLLESARRSRSPLSATHDPVRELGGATAAIGAGATWHEDVDFRGSVALGFASHVASGCAVEDAIVLPEAWLSPGCRLRRVIVGNGTELPAGTTLEDALVCQDPGPSVSLAEGTVRDEGLLIRPLRR